jgi:hypothetical protein
VLAMRADSPTRHLDPELNLAVHGAASLAVTLSRNASIPAGARTAGRDASQQILGADGKSGVAFALCAVPEENAARN